MRDVVSIENVLRPRVSRAAMHDKKEKKTTYIVPVPVSRLHHGLLEAESARPGAWFGRLVSREGQLATIRVPGADEMGGLDVGGRAQREVDLH